MEEPRELPFFLHLQVRICTSTCEAHAWIETYMYACHAYCSTHSPVHIPTLSCTHTTDDPRPVARACGGGTQPLLRALPRPAGGAEAAAAGTLSIPRQSMGGWGRSSITFPQPTTSTPTPPTHPSNQPIRNSTPSAPTAGCNSGSGRRGPSGADPSSAGRRRSRPSPPLLGVLGGSPRVG